MADSMPNDGIIYTIEHDKNRQKLAEENFASYRDRYKINLIKGKAKDVLLNLHGPFDMVFIDVDKPNYNLYLDWAESNVRYGGLIIADDCFLSDSVYLDEIPNNIKRSTMESMKTFNNRLSDNLKYHSIMLESGRGFLVAIKCF
ncbi:O-methyltransferase, partial [bacterium]